MIVGVELGKIKSFFILFLRFEILFEFSFLCSLELNMYLGLFF